MPRDVGTGIYHYPDGTLGNPGQTIFSTRYNTFLNDLTNTLNQPLPINMGGTGGASAATARDNLDAEVAMVTVTNYDTHVFENGSFWSAIGATAAPLSTRQFVGMAQVGNNDPNWINLSVVTLDNIGSLLTFTRQKVSGTWGSWTQGRSMYTGGYEGISFINADMFFGVTGTAPGSYFLINSESDPTTGSNLYVAQKTTGTHFFQSLGGNGNVVINKAASGNNTSLFGSKNLLNRWEVNLGSVTAESGSNSGSDFAISRYNDAGGLIEASMILERETGRVRFVSGFAIFQGATTPGITSFNTTTNIGYGLFSAADSKLWLSQANSLGGQVGSALLTLDTSGNAVMGAGLNVTTNAVVTGTLAQGGPALSIGRISNRFVTGQWGVNIDDGSSVGGNSHIVFTRAGAATILGSIANNVNTGVVYNTTSDERLKTDLKSFDAGNIIDDTNVYDFAWKSTGARAYGVIAQQAVDIYPAAVTYMKDQDWYGVDYSKYVPVILQELKALRARVAELEGRLEGKPA